MTDPAVHADIEKALIDSMQEISVTGDAVQEIHATFVFGDDFPGFEGHFPDQPVFAAIFQIALVRLLAERALECPLVTDVVERTKFKGIVLPREKIKVSVHLTETEQGRRAVFTLDREGERVSEGKLLLGRGVG